MDFSSLLVVIAAIVVLWLVLDLFAAGGGMTAGMMGGMAGMMGSGIGPVLLLVLFILALLAYGGM